LKRLGRGLKKGNTLCIASDDRKEGERREETCFAKKKEKEAIKEGGEREKEEYFTRKK